MQKAINRNWNIKNEEKNNPVKECAITYKDLKLTEQETFCIKLHQKVTSIFKAFLVCKTSNYTQFGWWNLLSVSHPPNVPLPS